MIAGINCVHDIKWLNFNVLILGYKWFGGGLGGDGKLINVNIGQWKYFIIDCMHRAKHIAFDNLALEQLRIKEQIPADVWDKHYMGDDGKFSMYIDATNLTYAKSSTCPRVPLNGMGVCQAFKKL